MYAAPNRGAKLYQVVRHSGVPCGANVQELGPAPSIVYGFNPFVTPGAGFTSQRNPSETLKRDEAFHSSCAYAEKFLYKGYAAPERIAWKLALFDSSFNQIGTTLTRPLSAPAPKVAWIGIGQHTGHGDDPAAFTYYDNVLIDWTRATFPLLPR